MIFKTIKAKYKKIFTIPVTADPKPLGTLTLGQMTVPFDKSFWFPSPVYNEHEDRINKIIERIK